jgi:hypothetical protein
MYSVLMSAHMASVHVAGGGGMHRCCHAGHLTETGSIISYQNSLGTHSSLVQTATNEHHSYHVVPMWVITGSHNKYTLHRFPPVTCTQHRDTIFIKHEFMMFDDVFKY